nr:putative integron gene cassette protein [uncultured bacterium]
MNSNVRLYRSRLLRPVRGPLLLLGLGESAVVVLAARAVSIRRMGHLATGSLAFEEPSSGRLRLVRAWQLAARARPIGSGLACHVRGGLPADRLCSSLGVRPWSHGIRGSAGRRAPP